MKPFDIINLDKPRQLRLPIKAMIEFEGITGQSLLKRFDLKVETMMNLLWVMLKQDDKDITLDDVIALVENANQSLDKISGQIIEVVINATIKDKNLPNAKTPTTKTKD